VIQDLLDNLPLVYEADDFHQTTAVRTKKRVHFPDLFDTFPPDQRWHLLVLKPLTTIISLSSTFFSSHSPAAASALRLSPRILFEYQPKYRVIFGQDVYTDAEINLHPINR
jgi:hypothetical protein